MLWREDQADTLQRLPVLTVAMNFSFRLENSFIRFRASFAVIMARGGRSILISLMAFDFFITPPTPFSYFYEICQLSRPTPELTGRRTAPDFQRKED